LESFLNAGLGEQAPAIAVPKKQAHALPDGEKILILKGVGLFLKQEIRKTRVYIQILIENNCA